MDRRKNVQHDTYDNLREETLVVSNFLNGVALCNPVSFPKADDLHVHSANIHAKILSVAHIPFCIIFQEAFMTTVRELISPQGASVVTISPQATVLEALKKLAEHNIGALLVTEGDQIRGILSERDCVRKLDLAGRSATTTRVEEIMTPRVFYIEPSRSIEECMALMIEKNIRHLPVMEGNRLLGIISVRDVLKAVIKDQQILISNLERYITGG